jgi:drug/metabolite transporter (DMT)-like permease
VFRPSRANLGKCWNVGPAPQGTLLLVCSAACLAIIGPTVKGAYDAGASAWSLLALRFLAAFAALVLLTRGRMPLINWAKRGPYLLLLAGILGGAVAGYLEFSAYRLLPVAHVVIVLFLLPVWLALVNWLFKGEPIGLRNLAAIGLVILGLVLLYRLNFRGFSLRGFALAVMASGFFASFYLLVQAGMQEISPLGAVGLVVGSASATCVIASVLEGTLILDAWNPTILWRAGLLGVVGTGLALTFLFAGMNRTGALRASVVGAVEPVLAAALAWSLRGESLGLLQITGSLMVIAGALIVQPSGAAQLSRTDVEALARG